MNLGNSSQPAPRRLNLQRRPLLKANQCSVLVDIPVDEESLIRYCTLDRAELDLILAKRTAHNRLGLAIQLCFLRHLGRAVLSGEVPPAPIAIFVAGQIGVNPGALAAYGRRDTNRREHAAEVQRHLGLHAPARVDRRTAMAAALMAATATDKGLPIAETKGSQVHAYSDRYARPDGAHRAGYCTKANGARAARRARAR